MMSTCPVCGRKHLIHWPEFWPYRRRDKLFCSEDCLIVHVTQENFSKYKGVRKKMARMKKDGTPAKKPGPRKKIEVPEKMTEVVKGPVTPDELYVKFGEDGWKEINNVEIPETPKTMQPAEHDGMIIREVEGLFGRYRYSGDLGRAEYLDFENADGLDTLSLTVDQWRKFREEQVKAAEILGVKL